MGTREQAQNATSLEESRQNERFGKTHAKKNGNREDSLMCMNVWKGDGHLGWR